MTGGETMNYVLRCEKCDRPAEIMIHKVGRQRTGHETIKKTSAHTCECGGKIVPKLD